MAKTQPLTLAQYMAELGVRIPTKAEVEQLKTRSGK